MRSESDVLPESLIIFLPVKQVPTYLLIGRSWISKSPFQSTIIQICKCFFLFFFYETSSYNIYNLSFAQLIHDQCRHWSLFLCNLNGFFMQPVQVATHFSKYRVENPRPRRDLNPGLLVERRVCYLLEYSAFKHSKCSKMYHVPTS